MGVIDLNARVTALERNGAGGAEIDQIEADLTALEETVGDLVENVSSKITLNTSLEGNLYCTAYRFANYVFANITADITSSVTYGTAYDLCDIDDSLKPKTNTSIGCKGLSGSTVTGALASVTTGKKITTTGGKAPQISCFWPIDTTT